MTVDFAAEEDNLFNLLTPELQAGVINGSLEIQGPGQNDKPVVVDAQTKKWVKGSGRPLNANDPAYIGKTTAYKRSKPWADALHQLAPSWKDDEDAPDAIISFQELIQAAKEAIVGQPEFKEHECSECHHVDRVWVGTKRDNKVLVFMIERLAGAANKTQTINTHSEELIRILNDTHVLTEVTFVGMTPEERTKKTLDMQALLA